MVRWSIVAALIVAGLCGAPGASADIIAAVDVPLAAGPSTAINQHPDQFDIALVNATTGSRFALPAGVNTFSADEFHPSITPDGKWLAFERVDPAAGTTRIIAANLSTGQQADLFNTFDTPTFQPATPFVEPDGSAVLTGTPYTSNLQWTQTPLASFPAAPFAHSQIPLPISRPAGRTLDPVTASFASGVSIRENASGTEDVVLFTPNSAVTITPQPGVLAIAHPTLSDPTTDVAVMERRVRGACGGVNQCAVLAQLGFLPDPGDLGEDPILLPPIVNTPGLDEAFPAFTPDGRYLGFVRQLASNDDRLFVFDTVTQTLLNEQGVELGTVGAPLSPRDQLRRLEGNLSLRQTFVLAPTFQLLPTGTLSFNVLTTTGVGLLIQRIVGHHRLFGHTVRALQTVGHVPLGTFSRGKHTLHWNLRVGGHKLRRGTYLVTPRSVTAKKLVTGLGTPRTLTVR